mmetsp:Transcript_6420/g.14044  ORF Transcript_6420/g.14044 Transcript_6420/m.14044 type:complete len:282 (-) Transcript_6420:107-952(-)
MASGGCFRSRVRLLSLACAALLLHFVAVAVPRLHTAFLVAGGSSRNSAGESLQTGCALTPAGRNVGTRARTVSKIACRQPGSMSLSKGGDLAPLLEWQGVGGSTTRGLFIAAVAASAAAVLHYADRLSRILWALPLWAPPAAAACVMFAVAGVDALESDSSLDLGAVTKLGFQAVSAVAGSCCLAVFAGSCLSSVAARRAVAVAACAAWMILSPTSKVFPPSAAYSVLYIDQLILQGPFVPLSYKYAFFPCALGVLVVLYTTHLAALAGSKPLRMFSRLRR